VIDTYGVPVPGLPTIPLTVVIPTHPARGAALDPSTLLGRAVASVRAQTLQPAGGIAIACDLNGDGAAVTRQRALDAVTTPWCSFLDSDDWLYPQHLETHWRLLQENNADVAYSWWGGNRPFSEATHRGLAFDNAHPHHITVTITVRTELAKLVGFLAEPMHPDWYGEDWKMITGLAARGAKFVGTAEETWFYDSFHGGNSSGIYGKGDAGPWRP
jgi:hypothetical protein